LKPKNLLNQLAELEGALQNFSFEELSTDEAKRLKNSFDSFRRQLESRIFGQDPISLNPSDSEIHPGDPASDEGREAKLIATVSHEIRTPLSGIVGFADLLGESKLNEDQKEQVKAIRSASGNLMEIINELLEYSKILAGMEKFDSIAFNFSDLINETVYLCQNLISDKDVELRLDKDPLIPEILKGDPAKLSQVLLNLIGNSIKFVENGSISLNISLIKERQDKVWIEFVVSDTGIGISEEDLQHIFDSFRQANQDIFSKYGGTGLGLNIVKQIVHKLKGELEVSSRKGVGTTFRFTIPYAIGKEELQPKTTTAELSPRLVNGINVLVFEDNLLNQRLIEKRLKAWGVNTYVTENGYYGLDLLEKTKIDLILMDLRMPVMSGYEVSRLIRDHRLKHIRQIPIVALTADFTIEDQEECEGYGIDDYILKPYRSEVLLAKIIQNIEKTPSASGLKTPLSISERNAPSETDLIDLKPALEDCMGDITLLRELVVLFKQNALEFIGKVKIYQQQDDFGMIRDAAHKIKCGLAMMHTHELHFIVEQIHDNCKTTKDSGQIRELYDRFVAHYRRVEKAIDIAVENLDIKG